MDFKGHVDVEVGVRAVNNEQLKSNYVTMQFTTPQLGNKSQEYSLC